MIVPSRDNDLADKREADKHMKEVLSTSVELLQAEYRRRLIDCCEFCLTHNFFRAQLIFTSIAVGRDGETLQ